MELKKSEMPKRNGYLKSKYAFPKSYRISFGLIVKFKIRRYKSLIQARLEDFVLTSLKKTTGIFY